NYIQILAYCPTRARCGNKLYSNSGVADDLALLASSQQDLQCALDRFAAESELAGMKVSTKKTEVMVISRLAVDCTLHVSGVQLQQVEKSKYLGSWFASDGRLDRELDSRINLSSVVLRELWSVMGSARLRGDIQRVGAVKPTLCIPYVLRLSRGFGLNLSYTQRRELILVSLESLLNLPQSPFNIFLI